MQRYDLIVIGSGPEVNALPSRARKGKRVAVIEKQSAIGGVGINTGTIPSKTMREAVLHLSGFYSKNFYGANRASAENERSLEIQQW
jgi:NAD(P) transhydrogenase